jgi:hypothetical protein
MSIAMYPLIGHDLPYWPMCGDWHEWRHPLSLAENTKKSLIILIILMRGSILLLKYMRFGSSAIFEAVVVILGPWHLVSCPSKVQSLAMVYVATSLPPPADVVHWHPSAATPPRPSLFSILSSSAPACFPLVVSTIQIDEFILFSSLWFHPLQKQWYCTSPMPPAHHASPP